MDEYTLFWLVLLLILTVVVIRRRRKGPLFAPHGPNDVESFKGCLMQLVIMVIWFGGAPILFGMCDERAESLENGKSGRVVGLNGRSVYSGKCGNCGVLRLDHIDSKYYFDKFADLKYGDSVFKYDDTVWRVREVNGENEVTFISSDKED
jgi:hypothetical protein